MKLWKNTLSVALSGVLIFSASFGVPLSYARITAQTTEEDAVCWGPEGEEICLDENGNWVPTTDDASDLGTSSLQFKDGFFDGTLTTDALSNSGALTQTGAATFSSTMDIAGQTTIGADGTKSTFTATGFLSVPQNITSGTGVIAATGTFTGAVDIDGDLTIGADTFVSTWTASNGSLDIGGTLDVTGDVQADGNILVDAGFVRLFSRTEAQLLSIAPSVVGEIYYCSDCAAPALVISTGTSSGNFALADGSTFD